MPRVISKEVKDHLHELFHIGTQGVDKMLPIFMARVPSPKLARVNQSAMPRWMHCKPHNATRVEGYGVFVSAHGNFLGYI